jgi:hypothetical protein
MNASTIILIVVIVGLFVPYVMRRRSRLGRQK